MRLSTLLKSLQFYMALLISALSLPLAIMDGFQKPSEQRRAPQLEEVKNSNGIHRYKTAQRQNYILRRILGSLLPRK
jgi:hypothetical protein